ncbi:WD40 repeat domain-containing protein [Mesorhizobium sp. B2-8-3]|uniref:WD40 repeat domain-containing protein n=1 Tax=Mesorhizobium sp. B2-8-3 TaxID=2589905 RepID=UPI001AEE6BFE|nr:WD40 repeat domain-containing protein [Mesorhizobium sp. B2-8-3]
MTELQAKLERHPFAAVIGPSGSGKSSVVLAGLAPKLLAQDWNVAVCRPLRDPLFQLGLGLASLTNPNPADFSARNKEAEEWAARLRNDPGRIVDLARQIGGTTPGRQRRTLLVIDQFEELFTHDAEAPDGAAARRAEVTDEDGSPRQAQFLAVLDAIAAQDPDSSPVRAVATMRADFMAHALAIRRLAGLLQDTDVKLGPMTAAELSEAVRRPARSFGVEFEDGLAEELVTAMQGRTGGLPLLQFALDRLWRQQAGCRLTWAAYKGPDGKGGLETALNEHAEGVVRRLGGAAEAGVRRVMLRLVRLGEDGAPDTRAVARRREIGEADWPLVQKLADERSRLLTLGRDPATGEETAEVVHEALIGAWGRLQGWLQEDRAFGLWRQRLKESLQAWTASPEDQDVLLRGRLLSEASTWLESRGDDLNDAERAFIKASQDHARQEAEEELEQARERERLANELAKAAQESERRAQELAEAAQEREQLARELAAAAQERARTEKDLADTRGLALHDAEVARKRWKQRTILLRAVVALLLIALAASGYFLKDNVIQRDRADTARDAADKSASAEMAAKFRALAAAGKAETARLAAEATAREAKGRQLGAEAVSIQGDLQGADSAERAAALAIEGWRRFPTDAAYQAAVNALRKLPQYRIEHGGPVSAVAFSPSGDLLATGSKDGTVRLIRTVDGKEVARIENGSPVSAVAFSPNGELLATGGNDGGARLIRTADGKEMARIEHDGPVNAIAFSPNGDLLAAASEDGSAGLIRTADGKGVTGNAHEQAAPVTTVAFSPKGDLLATGSWDGNARLIRTADGSEFARIHSGVPEALAFSPNGDMLAIASMDGSAKLIRTVDGKEAARIEHGDAVRAVAFSPKGDMLATGSEDNSARLINIADGSEAARIERGERVNAIAFSPKGDLFATASDDGNARLTRTTDGKEVARIKHDGPVNTVAFSPQGEFLATVSADGGLRLILTADGREAARIEHGGPILAVAFSPNGDLLAVASEVGTVRLIRPADGSEVIHIDDGEAALSVGFSPNGDLLATGSDDGTARLFHTADGKEVIRIKHSAPVRTVAFSPRGDLLATGSDDGTARLIRIRDGSEAARVEHDDWVRQVAFSPNGDLLAIASDNGSVRLIRTDDGKEVARIEHRGSVNAVAFSPQGDLLATASSDNSARLLLTPERVFEKLCRERVGRNLSAEEWQRHIGPIKDWVPTCQEWASEPSLLSDWQKRTGRQNNGGQN